MLHDSKKRVRETGSGLGHLILFKAFKGRHVFFYLTESLRVRKEGDRGYLERHY